MTIKELSEIKVSQLSDEELLEAEAMENMLGHCGCLVGSCGEGKGIKETTHE